MAIPGLSASEEGFTGFPTSISLFTGLPFTSNSEALFLFKAISLEIVLLETDSVTVVEETVELTNVVSVFCVVGRVIFIKSGDEVATGELKFPDVVIVVDAVEVVDNVETDIVDTVEVFVL